LQVVRSVGPAMRLQFSDATSALRRQSLENVLEIHLRLVTI